MAAVTVRTTQCAVCPLQFYVTCSLIVMLSKPWPWLPTLYHIFLYFFIEPQIEPRPRAERDQAKNQTMEQINTHRSGATPPA